MLFNEGSYRTKQSLKRFHENDGISVHVDDISPVSRVFFNLTKTRFGGVLAPREVLCKVLLHRYSPGHACISFTSFEDDEKYPKSKKNVRVNLNVLFILREGVTKVTENDGGGEVAHTTVETFVELDAGVKLAGALLRGTQGSFAGGRKIIDFLTEGKRRFDSSIAVDRAQRLRDMKMFREKQVYSLQETTALAAASNMFTNFKDYKVMDVQTRAGTFNTLSKDPNKVWWGHSKTVVSTSPQNCLAFLWNSMSRASEKVETILKEVVERKNDHNYTLYVLKENRFKALGVANRDFVTNFTWKKLDGKQHDEYLLVMSPLQSYVPIQKLSSVAHHRLGQKRGSVRLSRGKTEINELRRVRGEIRSCFLLKEVSRVVRSERGGGAARSERRGDAAKTRSDEALRIPRRLASLSLTPL